MTHITQRLLRINGDTGNNIFVFGNSLATIANGGAGEDYYLYLSGQVTISDYSSDNRLYFGANITIAAANISQSQLHISFEGTEDTLRLRNFSSYRFFIGGDSEDSSVPFEVNHTQFIARANEGFTVNNVSPLLSPPIITPASEPTVEIRANGTIDADTFSLGYDLRAEFNGGAGRDIFAISPYQTGDVQIRDFSVGNFIRFESGVGIANFSINRGTFDISLENDAIVSVMIGRLQNYQLGEGTAMDADDFIAALAPTNITLGNQVTTLAEDVDTSNAMTVATISTESYLDLVIGGLQLTEDDSRLLFEFNADQSELLLRANAPLDFETNPNLTVTVSSILNPGINDTLMISLSDVNDESPMVERTIPPQAIALADGAFTLEEMLSSFFSDRDAADDSLSYMVASGDTNVVTATIADGSTLTLTPMAVTDTPVSITVTASDGIGQSIAQTFNVYVSAYPLIPAIEVPAIQMSDDNGGFVLNGASGGDNSGFSVSGAGDVNGDGLDDIIVGAPLAAPNGDLSGASYVVFGKSDGGIVELSTIADDGAGFVLNGVDVDDRSGFSVSGAGDINGDGLDDIIIGASRGYVGGSASDTGVGYVVFGKSDSGAVQLSTIDDDSNLDGFAIIVPSDNVGRLSTRIGHISVSRAGDVNGDGLDDILIGTPYADPNGTSDDQNNGASYVVFGKTDGGNVTLAEIDDGDTDEGFAINGGFLPTGASHEFSGWSVSDAGDVNGDGLDDVIIGAPNVGDDADNSRAHSGASYVVFGKTDGGVIELSDIADASSDRGFAIEGGPLTGIDTGRFDVNILSGASVSGAGDVNGDGLDDVIIGAYYHYDDDTGASYVVFGKTSNDIVELSNIADDDDDTGFIIKGVDAGDRSGYSVSGAGDINGDGLDDFIIGARDADPNGDESGTSYLVFGKTDGNAVELSLVEEFGIGGFVINGASGGDQSGFSVSGAGDVDGDGFDDLIVGANGADPNNVSDSGASYVIFGGQGVLASAMVGDEMANTLTGSSIANQLIGGAGDDTLIGNGGEDVLRGGRGNDVLVIGNNLGDTGFAVIDGGLGNDTLRLNSTMTLDLTSIPNNRLDSIEVIDLNGTASTLILATDDILSIVGSGAENTLQIDGGSADVLYISAPFTDNPVPQVIDGTSYRVYQAAASLGLDDSVSLLVAPDVSVEITIPATELAAIQMSGDNNGFVLNGVTMGDNSGFSVSGAGDVNGDGLDDIIVGAPFADPNGNLSGVSYVVFGKSDGGIVELSTIADDGTGFVLNGVDANDRSGFSVSGAGDINGDGLDDIIIGASRAQVDGSISDTGVGYVVFGKSDSGAVQLSTIDDGNNLEGFAISTVADFRRFPSSEPGHISVSRAGDVNGDGLDDILIGTPYADPNGAFYDQNNGASYVVFGKSDGGNVTLAEIDDGDTDEGFAINGGFLSTGVSHELSGWSVSDAGDVNGDGLDDVIIGAPNVGDAADGQRAHSGASYVVFGKTDGGVIELSDIADASSERGFAIEGGPLTGIEIDNGEFHVNILSGASVSGAGDVNGDGLDDVIIGANGTDPSGLLNSGASYVVFGKTSNDIVELSNIADDDDDAGFIIKGVDAGDRSGYSVSGAGDINGDGLDDLIIGARNADPNGDESGASYLVFGKSDGSTVELSLVELGINGFVINGASGGDSSGRSVSGAGDVDGDGFDDLLVGALGADGPNGNDSGASYVIFGGQGVLSTDAQSRTGTSEADRLIGGAGNDVLVGGGGEDVLRGGAGDDVLAISNSTISNTDSISIDGGLGNDTLRFDAPITLDLSMLGRSKIRSIETIDLADGNDSTLSLGLSDVLAISAQTTLANPLMILGDGGDTVNLLGTPTNGIAGVWTRTDSDANNTYSYTASASSEVLANILIDSDIIVPDLMMIS